MTPADRDALIARAKRLAVPLASCVAARILPDHLIGTASRAELAALVLVLAEAADPVTLRAVVQATETGPDITPVDVMLRKAHAHAEALRSAGLPVPPRVRALDGQYRRRLAETRAPSRIVPAPALPDARAAS
jgi:hypothetical protein